MKPPPKPSFPANSLDYREHFILNLYYMKRLILLIPIFLVAILLQNCADEENVIPQNIQFTLQVASSVDGRTATELPEGTALLLSLQKNSGEEVFTHKKIELLKLGDSYVTAPLQLGIGSYKVTDFLLVNAASEILHATPMKGSRLAEAVQHPLPYNFNVSKNKAANIAMEVIPAGTNTPEDFGFASFGVGVVNVFQLSVFTGETNDLELSAAEAIIMNGDDTLHRYSLKAKSNLVPFYDDPNASYTLAIVKNGYARHTQSFVYKDVVQSLNNQSMQVILKPAVTMIVKPFIGMRDRVLVPPAAVGLADRGGCSRPRAGAVAVAGGALWPSMADMLAALERHDPWAVPLRVLAVTWPSWPSASPATRPRRYARTDSAALRGGGARRLDAVWGEPQRDSRCAGPSRPPAWGSRVNVGDRAIARLDDYSRRLGADEATGGVRGSTRRGLQTDRWTWTCATPAPRSGGWPTLSALTQVFARPDSWYVENAVQATRGAAGAGRVRRRQRAAGGDHRPTIRRWPARSRRAAGSRVADDARADRALRGGPEDRARGARAEAARLGYAPLAAEAALSDGRLRMAATPGAEAEAALAEAVRLGIANDQYAVAAEAAVIHMYVVGSDESRRSEGLASVHVSAEALGLHARGDARLVALLRNNIGTLHDDRGAASSWRGPTTSAAIERRWRVRGEADRWRRSCITTSASCTSTTGGSTRRGRSSSARSSCSPPCSAPTTRWARTRGSGSATSATSRRVRRGDTELPRGHRADRAVAGRGAPQAHARSAGRPRRGLRRASACTRRPGRTSRGR